MRFFSKVMIYDILCSSPEKTMATHSSTLAWEIPWTEEPGRLQSMRPQRVGHDWVTSLSLFTFMHWRRKWQPTPVFLPGESQGREPGGLPSMGSHRIGHNWCDLAAAAVLLSTSNLVKTLILVILVMDSELPGTVFLDPCGTYISLHLLHSF